MNILIKEFVPRLGQVLNEKVQTAENGGVDQIRYVLEKVEDEMRQSKKEN